MVTIDAHRWVGPLLAMLAPWLGLAALVLAWVLPRAHRRQAGLTGLGLGDGAQRRFVIDRRPIIARVSGNDLTPQQIIALQAPAPTTPRLRIVPLRALDRLARRLRVAAVTTSGDAAFDRRFLIDGDYRDLGTRMLADSGLRDAISALFDAGARELSVEHGQAQARFCSRQLLDAPRPGVQLAQWAILLARSLAPLPRISGALTPLTPLWPQRRVLAIIGCLALPLLALIALAQTDDAYLPLDLLKLARISLLPLLPAAAAVLLIGALLARGHPTSGRLLPPLLLATVLAAPCGTLAAVLRWNAIDGVHAPVTRTVPVTARQQDVRFSRPVYHWSSSALKRRVLLGSQPVVAEVRPGLWTQTPLSNARIRVMLVPGRLGVPWIADTTAVAAPQARSQQAARPVPPRPPARPPASAPYFGPQPHIAAQLEPSPPASGLDLLAQARARYAAGDLPQARALMDRAVLHLRADAAPPAALAEAYWFRSCLYAGLGGRFDAQRARDKRAMLALLPDEPAPVRAKLVDQLASAELGADRYDLAKRYWDRDLAPRLRDDAAGTGGMITALARQPAGAAAGGTR